MALSHVNPMTGDFGRCSAAYQCPFQKMGEELGVKTHFDTLKEAKVIAEQTKEKLFGAFATTEKVEAVKEALNDIVSQAQAADLTKDKMHELAKSDNHLVLGALANRDDLDEETVKLIVKNGRVRTGQTRIIESLIKNRNIPESSYKYLVNLADERRDNDLKVKLTHISRLPSEDLANLVKSDCNSQDFLYAVANHSQTTPEILDELFFRKNNEYYLGYISTQILKKPDLSEKMLLKILDEGLERDYPDVFKKVLEQKNLPKELKDKIKSLQDRTKLLDSEDITAKDLDEIIFYDASDDPNSIKKTMQQLKNKALAHENLSDDTAIKILQSDNPKEVNLVIDKHKVNSQEYADALLNITDLPIKSTSDVMDNIDRKQQARYRYVSSNFASSEELFKIANDIVSNVQKPGNHHRTKWYVENTLRAIIHNQNSTPEMLKKLSKNRLSSVKEAIARNSKTPDDVLIRYSGMQNGNLLHDLSKNPKLPVEAQINMVDGNINDSYLLSQLLDNPNISAEAIDKMVWRRAPKNLIEKIREHPKTSMKTLLKLGAENAENE